MTNLDIFFPSQVHYITHTQTQLVAISSSIFFFFSFFSKKLEQENFAEDFYEQMMYSIVHIHQYFLDIGKKWYHFA